MTTKKVLCTGGSGFIAHWMEQTQPPECKVLWLNRSAYNQSWYLEEAWDAIVHLAPVSPTRVLAYAQKHSTRVLFASSGAVYDRHDEYSDNKRKWERECADSGVDVVTVRPFCFVGECLQDTYSIMQFIREGVKGGPVHYYDAGCIRSYMYGADMGNWLWRILLDGESGAFYDVGASLAFKMSDIAQMVAQVCGCEAVEDLPQETGKPRIYMPDVTRALELGCKETVGIMEAIERTVAYARL